MQLLVLSSRAVKTQLLFSVSQYIAAACKACLVDYKDTNLHRKSPCFIPVSLKNSHVSSMVAWVKGNFELISHLRC